MEFSLAEDAREAIDNMDQSELYGRVIKCNQAKPQKDANEGLGSRTAVWEQVGFNTCIHAYEHPSIFYACSILDQILIPATGGICFEVQCH